MPEKNGIRFREELGCNIPDKYLSAFNNLDPQLVDIIKQKGTSTTNWGELALFFKLKHLNPQIAHQIAKGLKSTPSVPNRGQVMSAKLNKKKWNVLRVASKHLDDEVMKELELYLGVGIKQSIRQKVLSLLDSDEEGEAKTVNDIDEDFELWDILYDYLKTDNQIGEEIFNGDGEMSLQDLSSSVPHLVRRATKQEEVDPNQLTLPL